MMKQYIYAALAAAGLALAGWLFYTVRDDAKAAALAPVAEAAIKQAEVAAVKTREYQTNVDKANAQARAEEADTARRLRDLAAAEQRMLDADRARTVARASAEALRDYATDLDRDFADCREQYIALGGVATAASTAAHGLANGWPGQSQWTEAQSAFMKQAQDLIK